MLRSNGTEDAATTRFHPIRLFFQRLGRDIEEAFAPTPEELPFEPAFYVLDDVACAPVRRR